MSAVTGTGFQGSYHATLVREEEAVEPVKIVAYLVLVSLAGLCAAKAEIYACEPTDRKEVKIRGSVFCLDKVGQPLSDCTGHSGPFGLETGDGSLYVFFSEDPKAAMFRDPRVREKEIEVSGWLREEQLEINKLRALRDGELVEIFFRCDVCNITAFSPGPCWCCRQEFELRERPAGVP